MDNKIKTKEKPTSEDKTTHSQSFSRRKALAALGTTGLAFIGGIAGISKASAAEPRNTPSIDTPNHENSNAQDIYNIKDFGAIGDGKTLNTKAIQKTINICAKSGGGKVLIPSGTFLSGTIYTKSNINLVIEAGAILKGSDQLGNYENINGTFALILGKNLQNVSITGQGTINGSGKADAFQNGLNAGPSLRLIYFYKCKNVTVQNVHLEEPASWTQEYAFCEGVLVTGISVYAHGNWNNDGMDITSCNNVTISNSRIDSSDDAICLKNSESVPTKNVTITNCIVASVCNCIKMGTSSSGGFSNITISNCVIHQPSSDNTFHWQKQLEGITKNRTSLAGIAIENPDGGNVECISISNITMKGVQTPIFIRLEARERPIGTMQNINISNIVAVSESRISSSITGVPGHYVKDISIRNVQLINHATGHIMEDISSIPEQVEGYPENRMFGELLPASGFYIRHAKNITLENVSLNVPPKEKRPIVVADDAYYLTIEDISYGSSPPNNSRVVYYLRNVQHAVIKVSMLLTNFDKLLHSEGENKEDINLFVGGKMIE